MKDVAKQSKFRSKSSIVVSRDKPTYVDVDHISIVTVTVGSFSTNDGAGYPSSASTANI